MSQLSFFAVVVLLSALLPGCNPSIPRIPPNSDPNERAALDALLPLAENAAWNPAGRVCSIDLRGDAVGDEQLKQVGTLTDLRELGLNGSKITDDGLASIERLPKLASLSVQWTGITDAGVKRMAAIETLECLDLNHTQISDTSLEHLSHLKHLSVLFVAGTPLTEAAIQRFKQQRPDCRVQP